MIETTNPSQAARLAKQVIWPAVVATAALTLAIVGAFLLGEAGRGDDGINSFVEALSGNSQGFLGNLGILAPLGFAFVAGMVAAVNPCGFAMLPAYMGLYLGSNDIEEGKTSTIRHIARAILVGLAVTAGFVVLFGAVGAVIGLGARSFVADVLPWVGISIGFGLTLVGAWLLGGGKLYTELATRAASKMGNPGEVNTRGYFLFGLSYGTASLSCTLPIFLSVVGTSFAASSIATSFSQFVLYAAGMGMVIMALTLGMAVFKGAMVGLLRKALPYIQPVGTWMMIVAGAYIVFYWLTLGDILS